MKSTDSPKKHGIIFAQNGQKNIIPTDGPISNEAASMLNGFPPITMLKKTQGGLPPDGKDMNGILNELSALSRWYSAGALNKFDIAFSKEIGGYPKGALLIGDDEETLYLSTQEDNANNPNESKTGWIKYQDYLIENIPNSSLTQKGVTQLSNTLGQDQNTAATPKLVDDFKNTLGTAADKNVGTDANQIPDMSNFTFQKIGSVNVYEHIGLVIMTGQGTTDISGSVVINLPFALTEFTPMASEGDVSGWTGDSSTGIYSFCTWYGAKAINSSSFQVRSASWRVSDKNIVAQSTVFDWIVIGRI